jgi:hypothetical protein
MSKCSAIQCHSTHKRYVDTFSFKWLTLFFILVVTLNEPLKDCKDRCTVAE